MSSLPDKGTRLWWFQHVQSVQNELQARINQNMLLPIQLFNILHILNDAFFHGEAPLLYQVLIRRIIDYFKKAFPINRYFIIILIEDIPIELDPEHQFRISLLHEFWKELYLFLEIFDRRNGMDLFFNIFFFLIIIVLKIISLHQ